MRLNTYIEFTWNPLPPSHALQRKSSKGKEKYILHLLQKCSLNSTEATPCLLALETCPGLHWMPSFYPPVKHSPVIVLQILHRKIFFLDIWYPRNPNPIRNLAAQLPDTSKVCIGLSSLILSEYPLDVSRMKRTMSQRRDGRDT